MLVKVTSWPSLVMARPSCWLRLYWLMRRRAPLGVGEDAGDVAVAPDVEVAVLCEGGAAVASGADADDLRSVAELEGVGGAGGAAAAACLVVVVGAPGPDASERIERDDVVFAGGGREDGGGHCVA